LEIGLLCCRTKCFKGPIYRRFENYSFVILGVCGAERRRSVNEIIYAFDSFVECPRGGDIIDDYE